VNEEQLKTLNEQKDEIFQEIEMLRTTNRQYFCININLLIYRLRELIMDQRSTLFHTDEQEEARFNDTINKLKRKVEKISNQSLNHLQNIQGKLIFIIRFTKYFRLFWGKFRLEDKFR